MPLTDGDIANLAEQAALKLPGPVSVRIAPNAGADPYRWGARSWTVYFDRGPGHHDRAGVSITSADTEQAAAERLAAAVEQRAAADPPNA